MDNKFYIVNIFLTSISRYRDNMMYKFMSLVGKDTYQLTKLLISVVEAGVSITSELLFPGRGDPAKWERAKKRGTLKTAIKRLEKQKVISWEDINGELRLVLTENGKKKVFQHRLSELKIEKPSKWDGLFRLVIFDIPEGKKSARDMLRRKLKELEFQQLQKSVFVTPYECRDEIDFLKNVYEVAPYVSYVLAKEIPDITFDIPR